MSFGFFILVALLKMEHTNNTFGYMPNNARKVWSPEPSMPRAFVFIEVLMREVAVKGSAKPMLVDDEDYPMMSAIEWKVQHCGYAWGYVRREIAEKYGIERGMAYSHRIIAKTPKGMTTDHINLNKLDNRKENLRICTQKENTMNRPKRKDGKTSKYVGVSWSKSNKCFLASMFVDGKRKHVRAESERHAAELYNEYAKRTFGEFARLNVL